MCGLRAMSHMFTAWIACGVLLVGPRVGATQEPVQRSGQSSTKQESPERVRIGSSLGADVYRDELSEPPSAQDILRLFISKPMNKFYQEHGSECELTDAEIQEAVEWEATEVETQGGDTLVRWQQKTAELARTMPQRCAELRAAIDDPTTPKELRTRCQQNLRLVQLELTHPHATEAYLFHQNTKYERYLYDKFGGGRIDFDMRGVVAIDARNKLVAVLEERGQFEITDPELRKLATLIWEHPAPPGGFPTDRRLLEFPWTASFQEAKKLLDAQPEGSPAMPQ